MIETSIRLDGMNVIRIPEIVMRDNITFTWCGIKERVFRCKLVEHLIIKGNFMILPSFMHGLPADFFVKIV